MCDWAVNNAPSQGLVAPLLSVLTFHGKVKSAQICFFDQLFRTLTISSKFRLIYLDIESLNLRKCCAQRFGPFTREHFEIRIVRANPLIMLKFQRPRFISQHIDGQAYA